MFKKFVATLATMTSFVPHLASAQAVPADAAAKISRIDFTVAVVDEFYAQSNLDGCFANLAPSKTVTYTHLFSDVQKDQWYAKKLCVAMMAGIINGNRDGSFQPLDGITAAEASKILAQAFGLTYPAKNPTGAAWYESSMHALREIGALSATVQPGQILTKGHIDQMLAVLRKHERFPAERVIGNNGTPTAAMSAAMTRVGERVSRRTLRQRVLQKVAETK